MGQPGHRGRRGPTRGAMLLSALLCVAAGADAGDARIDYMLQCQGCHLADGSGSPGSVPALNDRMARFLLVPGGRDYLVRVPGSAQSPLADDRLAAVLNWMVREFGPAGIAASTAPYGADEVRRLRARPLNDVDAVRSALLDEIAKVEGRDAP